MNIVEIKRAAKGRLPEYLNNISEKKGGQWICPICGSGTGKNKTPAGQLNEDYTYHCYSCGFHGDVFDLIERVERLSNKSDAFKRAYELFSIKASNPSHNAALGRGRQSAPLSPSADPDTRAGQPDFIAEGDTDYTQYFKECRERSGETDYFSFRGIGEAVIDKFMLGYDPAWRSPQALRNGKNPPASARIIIPTGKNSYIARAVDPKADPRFKSVKEGQAQIFNAKAMYNPHNSAENPVFVVEGEIDALSVAEAGGQAVALGGVANKRKFIELITANPPKSPLILSLDNDAAGKKAQSEIAHALSTLKTPFLEHSLSGKCKDPNECLTSDYRGFYANVSADYAQMFKDKLSEKQKAYRKQHSVGAELASFKASILEGAKTPAIPTGFAELDKVLDDGLYDGLYILGAISSLGKTSFLLQMADQIAQNGQDVLVFSLEMAKSELMAKSISRLTYETATNASNAKTTRGILSGKRYENYSADEHYIIDAGIHKYSTYADNLFIFEGMGDIGAAEIREIVGNHIRCTGNKPVVIIDYLQILAAADPRATDKQNTDKAVFELKRMSRDFKIPVIGISSLNRANYTSEVSMAAFKESGAIEYSSDVLIGLQFATNGEKITPDAIDRFKRESVRKIELKVLKNRNGMTGDAISYDYNPMFNHFKETGRKIGGELSVSAMRELFNQKARKKI